MKRIIQIISAAFLAIGLCSTSFAQSTDSGNMTATATVLNPVVVTSVTALDFGEVQPTTGQNVTVNADGTGDTGTTVGEFTVTGSDATTVTLEFTTLSDLTDASSNTLTIDYNNVNYALWSTDADNSTSGDNTTFNPSSATPSATLDSDGISVFIGGQAQPTTGQPAGNYTGTVQLTATYN